jgi:hypothetical protein
MRVQRIRPWSDPAQQIGETISVENAVAESLEVHDSDTGIVEDLRYQVAELRDAVALLVGLLVDSAYLSRADLEQFLPDHSYRVVEE